jgi:hypothetical protein
MEQRSTVVRTSSNLDWNAAKHVLQSIVFKMFSFGFQVCRVCRSSPEAANLLDIFTDDGGVEEKIRSIAKVDVS